MLADDGTFQYRTLGEGLASGDVSITEVSKAGSVPELMATNRGKLPVLLLDGEELVGAKQNRVLNTSILLRELSETRVLPGGYRQRISGWRHGFAENPLPIPATRTVLNPGPGISAADALDTYMRSIR